MFFELKERVGLIIHRDTGLSNVDFYVCFNSPAFFLLESFPIMSFIVLK